MKALKIYVVFGSTGEYSDRSEWMVAAYTSQPDAEKHVTKASEYAAAWEARKREDDWFDLGYAEQRNLTKKANPMDPAFSCDYTGTSYYIGEVELRDSFTTVEAVH